MSAFSCCGPVVYRLIPAKLAGLSMGATPELPLLQADHQKHPQAPRELRQTCI